MDHRSQVSGNFSGIITEKAAEIQKRLLAREFEFHYPELRYGVLESDTAVPVDELYHTQRRSEREYHWVRMNVKPRVSPEEMEMTAYSIDLTRDVVFHVPTFTLERLSVEPKEGDVFDFEGDLYEVIAARKFTGSRLAATSVYLLYEFITRIPRDER